MVTQKIKDIDIKKLKMAKHVLSVFEIMGITEDDLDALKNIKSIREEIVELREFKQEIMRYLKNEAKGGKVKPIAEQIKDKYGKAVEEFNFNGDGK